MKKPIVKLLNMQHANMGDRLAAIMAHDFLAELGIPTCGGDLDELRNASKLATHLLVWGGGTIYETETGTDGPIHKWGLLEDSRTMKTLFVSPGFNGISSECSSEVISDWKEVLDNASLVSLRDRESIEECQKTFGVKLDNRYCHHPEISFMCKKYIDLNVPKAKDLAAYSTNVNHFELEDHIRIVDSLHNQGMRILFFAHSEDDYWYYIANDLVGPRDHLVNLRESPIAALQLLATTSLQVTSRLHGMIMSIIAEVPFVHINTNMLKVYWQLEEIGFTKYPYLFENPNTGLLNNYPVVDFSCFGDIISAVRTDIWAQESLIQVAQDSKVGAEVHLQLVKENLLGD
jgi:polysaccharide pyruvyl transferase WcaK-like protein